MNGITLCEKYFFEEGLPRLKGTCPALIDRCAFALTGDGSECFGYDDEISTDHDFEPGFQIFIPDDVTSQEEFALERAYAKLPDEFEGLRRLKFNPAGGSRHGVIRTSGFFRDKTGFAAPPENAEDWLRIPQFALAAAVNGKVFLDETGDFTKRREGFKTMPRDASCKRIAGHLFLMSQSGQYNFERCLAHGETTAAQLALFEFADNAMSAAFLICGRYKPFYKWAFRALRELDGFSQTADIFDYLLTTDNLGDAPSVKTELIEDTVKIFVDKLQSLDMTKAVCLDLSKHAQSVNDAVADANIRNMNLLAGIV